MKRRPPAKTRHEPAARKSRGGGRRRVWFRLVALVLPFLLLVLLEGLLRWVGYGYPTSYFIETTNKAGPVLVSNMDFTRRFFPPGLERTPLPLALPPRKSDGAYRIFVFGESAAMGDPAPAFGFARILEVLLREQFPGRAIEVANVATTAINSHVLREIAQDCAEREGDLWILYMGNNEVVGPYGAGTVFSEQAPPLPAIRATLTWKQTRLSQALERLQRWASPSADPPASWEGMEMFLDRQVAANAPAMDRVYRNFERNLHDLIRLGLEAQARVLVCTVGANLKDCSPFASPAQAPEVEASLEAARRHLGDGEAALALAALQQVETNAMGSADLFYLMGKSALELENYDEARRDLVRARDLDTLRFRVDSRMNGIIQRSIVGLEPGEVVLVDAEEVLARQYPHRTPGEEFFYEHVHFNFEGNYLIARVLAEAVAALWDRQVPSWLTAEECAGRLGWTDWAKVQVLEEVIQRLSVPPFRDQYGNEHRVDRLRRQQSELQAGLDRPAMEAAAAVYEKALDRAPDDWHLHEQYARYLEEMGAWKAARAHWEAVLEVVPNHFQARYRLANVLDTLGRSSEAIPHFRRVLNEQPRSNEALNGLAVALDNAGQADEARDILEAAVQAHPDFVEARINYGQLLARHGRQAEAKAQYEAALQRRTNSPGAHINLGKLLAMEGNDAEAERHYRAAVAAAPHNAVAHFNLANLLSKRQDPQADLHYEEAVRANPSFAPARLNWGLALARRGDDAAALDQFQAAVALSPEMIEARFSLGVALARQRRFAEAAEQFEAVLRLEPGHEQAAEFLARARAMATP